MVEIEKAWLGQQTNCPTSTSTSVSSNSLGLNSFWGLFLIAAVASSLALIIFITMFIYERWNVLIDPKHSLWEKFVLLAGQFNQRDQKSFTFRRGEVRDTSVADGTNGMASAVEGSPNTNCPPSTSSYSNYADSTFVDYGEQGTPPAENGNLSPNQETTREIVIAIELTNPVEERPITPSC